MEDAAPALDAEEVIAEPPVLAAADAEPAVDDADGDAEDELLAAEDEPAVDDEDELLAAGGDELCRASKSSMRSSVVRVLSTRPLIRLCLLRAFRKSFWTAFLSATRAF